MKWFFPVKDKKDKQGEWVIWPSAYDTSEAAADGRQQAHRYGGIDLEVGIHFPATDQKEAEEKLAKMASPMAGF